MARSVASVVYTNAVYFPNKRIYQGETPGMLNYACINHVYYAYANVSPDGSVFVSSFSPLAYLTTLARGVDCHLKQMVRLMC